MLTEIDYRIFQFINLTAGKDSFIYLLMRFFAEQAVYLFVLGLLAYGLTRSERNRLMVLETFVASCAAFGVSKLCGIFLFRERPFVEHDVIQLIAHQATASFPSNHATGTFVIAAVLLLYRKPMGLVLFLLASCVSFSRVWVGVHYPLDIVGGMINGILCAIVIRIIVSRWAWAQNKLVSLVRLYERLETRILTRIGKNPRQLTK
ncbi:phosphatase PAP2 family protein [Paenibacillus sp. LMG 31456]|uniref:Phosphatase PAP2 family protein n=1 Tax=Paenibacillus foliorum TaxID=2654974 RepID=A0A972K249_9BACL|nr:undecaprenyl-diphosphatase [Paenibacillus foliorum]NOU94568.1 phosphatase PAP2 family protein [Paenibacillus foliorum]